MSKIHATHHYEIKSNGVRTKRWKNKSALLDLKTNEQNKSKNLNIWDTLSSTDSRREKQGQSVTTAMEEGYGIKILCKV